MLTRWQSEILFRSTFPAFLSFDFLWDPKNKGRHLIFLRLTGTSAGSNNNSQHKPQRKKLEAESKCTTLTCACCIAISAVAMATDTLVGSNRICTVCVAMTRRFLAFVYVWKWSNGGKEESSGFEKMRRLLFSSGREKDREEKNSYFEGGKQLIKELVQQKLKRFFGLQPAAPWSLPCQLDTCTSERIDLIVHLSNWKLSLEKSDGIRLTPLALICEAILITSHWFRELRNSQN